jgi:excinuclease ABC subunit B
MAEELAKYLTKVNIRCRYIHSDIDTLERIEIMQDLRKGLFDVLIGVNLLVKDWIYRKYHLWRSWMPIKKVFSHRSLTQTIGRAARNLNGKRLCMPIKSLPACKKTIDETDYRRTKQINFNTANNQVPQALNKKIESAFTKNPLADMN